MIWLIIYFVEECEFVILLDGKLIVFVVNYEGINEVYVMFVNGGFVKCISFENSVVKVYGWILEGNVVFVIMFWVGFIGNWILKIVDFNILISIILLVVDVVEGVVDNSNELYFV